MTRGEERLHGGSPTGRHVNQALKVRIANTGPKRRGPPDGVCGEAAAWLP